MAKEAIQDILQAEEKARQIVQEGREKVAVMRDQWAEELLQEEQRIRSEADNDIKTFQEKTRAEALKEVQPQLDQAKEQAEKWRSLPDSALEPAVKKIIEEVMNYGNR